MTTTNTFTLALAALAAMTGLGCGADAEERPLAEGEATATVRGAMEAAASAVTAGQSLRALLVWTYWDDADCVEHSSGEGRSCSGSLHATEAALVDEGGYFVISATEPPPDFVHGYDVGIAEAFVAVVAADLDPAAVDLTDPSNRVGLATGHVVVYAPADFGDGTVEAALVGSPLGAGFHLAIPLEEGPQFEVVLEDGTEVISAQRAVLAPQGFDAEIVVTPGAEFSPWLGL